MFHLKHLTNSRMARCCSFRPPCGGGGFSGFRAQTSHQPGVQFCTVYGTAALHTGRVHNSWLPHAGRALQLLLSTMLLAPHSQFSSMRRMFTSTTRGSGRAERFCAPEWNAIAISSAPPQAFCTIVLCLPSCDNIVECAEVSSVSVRSSRSRRTPKRDGTL